MQNLEILMGSEYTLDQQRTAPCHPDVLDFTFIPRLIISPLTNVLPMSILDNFIFVVITKHKKIKKKKNQPCLSIFSLSQ